MSGHVRLEWPVTIRWNERSRSFGIGGHVGVEYALKRSQDYCPIPGTVLIREYKGVEHRVTVTHDGQFEYQGCVYRSLSRIAREITGAQWSGPLFFGLRKQARRGKEGGER